MVAPSVISSVAGNFLLSPSWAGILVVAYIRRIWHYPLSLRERVGMRAFPGIDPGVRRLEYKLLCTTHNPSGFRPTPE